MTRFGLVVFLMLLGVPAHAEQFSIKCIWDPGYIITFDEERKRMIWEVPQGMTYRGAIDSIAGDDIQFRLLIDPLNTGRIWNRKSGSLVPSKAPSDPKFENYCFRSELRPVMPLYDDMTR